MGDKIKAWKAAWGPFYEKFEDHLRAANCAGKAGLNKMECWADHNEEFGGREGIPSKSRVYELLPGA